MTDEIEYDKSAWGDGPWMTEPDREDWIDEATGLDCMILRNTFGTLCGYVGVPPDHPIHGKSYAGAETVDVHGGLTFAGERIPAEGRPDDLWWLGFDCNHYMDYCPGLRMHMPAIADRPERYRDIEYVRNEVTSLACQLVAT